MDANRRIVHVATVKLHDNAVRGGGDTRRISSASRTGGSLHVSEDLQCARHLGDAHDKIANGQRSSQTAAL